MLNFIETEKPNFRLVADNNEVWLIHVDNIKQAKMLGMKTLKNYGNGGHLETIEGDVICKTIMRVDSSHKCHWTKW